jgi:citrate synthase
MENEVFTIVDKRTEATYDLPLYKGAVRAMDLRQIKTGPEDFGVMTYDPDFRKSLGRE